jgi:hypothetical protein
VTIVPIGGCGSLDVRIRGLAGSVMPSSFPGFARGGWWFGGWEVWPVVGELDVGCGYFVVVLQAGADVEADEGDVGVAGSFDPDDDDPSQPKTPPFDGDGEEASAIFLFPSITQTLYEKVSQDGVQIFNFDKPLD